MIEYNNEKYNKRREEEGESEDGRSSQGGQDGALEFRDFVFVHKEQKLSPQEEKQLLAEHKETNNALVEKQKQLRDERRDRKENKTVGNQYGSGMQDREASFLNHPILSEAAQFGATDPKVNPNPVINDADTNSEKKEELVYQHQLRLGLQNQPRFNPKPSPF